MPSAYATIAPALKLLLPRAILTRSRGLITRAQVLTLALVLRSRQDDDAFLEYKDLVALQRKFQRTKPKDYSYEPEALRQRGAERAAEVLAVVPDDNARPLRILELGCGDGMTLAALNNGQRNLVGLDHEGDRFDQRARDLGVHFVEGDASATPFEAESFDVIFSYNSFEHFSDPSATYAEIVRLLASGGVFLADFGPLYHSPWGLHAYDSIHIPFCQHLFRREDILQFCRQNGLKEVDYNYVNGWRPDQFRNLFQSSGTTLETFEYTERACLHGIDLILKYPECFRRKLTARDDALVSSIRLLQRKF